MEILKKTCEHCGKEIWSMYEKQLEQNMAFHILCCPELKKKEVVK